MKVARLLHSSALLAVALAGCTKRDAPAPSAERPAGTLEQIASAHPKGPLFQADIVPVLTRHCAAAAGCHGDSPTDSVHLDLRATAAYAELVNHEAQARPGVMRVKPGDPARSFLVAKLKGPLSPGEGKTMPIDADTGTPLDPSPVPVDFIRTVLEPWITAEAPNN
jgi:hypothetical protein